MSIEQVEKAEIFPLNPPADGVYGFRKGFPIVQFQIANQDKFLNPQTLRLNGSLQLKTATGTVHTARVTEDRLRVPLALDCLWGTAAPRKIPLQ